MNLLQPQDRRSLVAGDRQDALKARIALLEAGVGRTILDEIVQRAESLIASHQSAVVVDLGSGSGDALGRLSGVSADARQLTCVGIDLSTAATTIAARRFPNLTWLVANADRRLPLLDQSVDLVMSLNGRRNPAECARVMKRDARLLVAIPAEDDLVELRERVQGSRVQRERAGRLVTDHASHFSVIDRRPLRERHHLARPALLDLLRGTYRGERMSATMRVATLESMDVTVAVEVFVFGHR